MTRKLSSVLVVVGLVLAAATVPGMASAAFLSGDSAEPTPINYHGHGSYIVEYETGEFESLENWANASSERYIVEKYGGARYAVVSAPKAQLVDVSLLEAGVAALGADPLAAAGYVEHVEPNAKVDVDPLRSLADASSVAKPTEGSFKFDDPRFPRSEIAFDDSANRTTLGQARQATGVSNVSATGSGVTIAYVDTGFNHANGSLGLKDNLVNSSADVTGSNVSTVNESGYSAVETTSHHGPWIAASLVANASNDSFDGVAPKADLLAIKALDDDGSGSLANVVEGVRYAADNGADVISLSLGSRFYSQELAEAIQYAREQGAIVVGASGNARVRRGGPAVATPADVEGVVTVGAVDVGSQPSNMSRVQATYFSQVGPDASVQDGGELKTQGAEVDVVAPGMKTVAKLGTTDETTEKVVLSGTSMATPIVAANIALIHDAHSSWSDSKVVKWVEKGARPVPKVSAAAAGNGMVAVDNAVATDAPETSQEVAQTDSAAARNEFYQTAASTTGAFAAL